MSLKYPMRNILSIVSFWRNDRWVHQINCDSLADCCRGGLNQIASIIEETAASYDKAFERGDSSMVSEFIAQNDAYHDMLNGGPDMEFESKINDPHLKAFNTMLIILSNIHWLCTRGHHPTDNWNGLQFISW